ncbi:MAG: hypothetical protein ABSC37_14270 [Xanthobacteraceae bacterium]
MTIPSITPAASRRPRADRGPGRVFLIADRQRLAVRLDRNEGEGETDGKAAAVDQ